MEKPLHRNCAHRVANEVARVKRDHGVTPGLAVVLVGNDPASEVYVRSKHTQTQAAGMASFEYRLPSDVAQADLLALIATLNRDPAVHGILVQLPLPKSIHTETVINAIDPAKDVDGLHPSNAGRLAGGFAALVALHAAWLHHSYQERACLTRGHECHRDRTLQPGRAVPWCNCC